MSESMFAAPPVLGTARSLVKFSEFLDDESKNLAMKNLKSVRVKDLHYAKQVKLVFASKENHCGTL